MKLSKYIKHLQEIEEKYSSDLKVVSYDDISNSFYEEYFIPVAGTLVGDNDLSQDEPDTYNVVYV